MKRGITDIMMLGFYFGVLWSVITTTGSHIKGSGTKRCSCIEPNQK